MKLRIEKAVYGGDGLGRIPDDAGGHGGKTVFVPHVLPGESVECTVTDDRRSFAHARLIEVLEPVQARIAPGCEYFSACGGCQYQHADYEAQIAIKRGILAETLGRAGLSIPENTIEVLHGEPWQYRNRIRLQIRFGDFALCYREAGSHRNVPVDHCPIAMPLLQQALRIFPEAASGCGVEAGLFDEVEFFTNAKEDTLLISLWTNGGSAAVRALPVLCEAIENSLPQLRGGLLFLAETQKGQGRQLAAWGIPQLTYAIEGRSYQVSAGAFFQVNRWLTPALVTSVIADHSGKTAWDLYAGVGLFSNPLAERFEHVVAVEQAAVSARDLRHNVPGKHHRVVSSGTLEFLKQEERARSLRAPELVIVDPPRAGLGKEVTALLSQIGPAEIIYVSCDPSTLARDVQALLHSGYQLRKTTLVDLFPQTYHLETIAELAH
jgi:23S rRNA (uracil1939-C5)-methyltransferase